MEMIGTTEDPIALAAKGTPLARTDIGFAERFAFQHKDKALYQPDAKIWYVWDGKRWRPDESLVLMRELGIRTARSIMQEVFAMPTDANNHDKENHFKFALRSEAREKINAGICLAASLGMSQPLEILDANPMLFNCKNGTVDLRTGELRSHNIADFITKISPVEFSPALVDPIFERFVVHITGEDPELASYLQRAAGYSLTGLTSEKCMMIVYSEKTDTGKSSFVEGLLAVAGDYGISLDIETFLDQKNGHNAARYDLAKLRGVRVAASSENNPGREFSDDVIKRLTGGDTVRAREIHQSSIQFAPTHKLWLCTNYSPAPTDGGDAATWNRLRRVPFNNQIPLDQRDPAVKRALENPHSDACKAFLSWAVAGVVSWNKSSLGSCAAVDASTSEYKTESQPLGDFIEDCCNIGPENTVNSAAIYDAYLSWCKAQSNKFTFSRQRVGRQLSLQGFEKCRTSSGAKAWKGLSLKNDPMQ